MTLIGTYEQPAGKMYLNSADILVCVGHGSYGWGDIEGLEEIFYTFDSDELAEQPEPGNKDFNKIHDMREFPEEIWKPFAEDYGEWGSFILVKGPLHRHHEAFERYAGSLTCSLDPSGHRPGGDDDYFDYWPSGMEGLKGYAIDLDEAFKMYEFPDFYRDPGFLGVYCNVLLDFLVREYWKRGPIDRNWLWEHIPDLVNELAELKKVPYHTVLYCIRTIGNAKSHLSPESLT